MIVNRFDYDKKRNTRSSRAGSRLFPLEKGAKELFARHFGSLLFISHVGTRSASLPKLARSRGLKHMERLVFVAAHATAMRSNKKSPHEPRNQILRALPWPTESYLRRSLFSTQICFVKPIFAHRMLLRSRWLKSQNSSHANPSSTETLTEGQGSRALRLLRGS